MTTSPLIKIEDIMISRYTCSIFSAFIMRTEATKCHFYRMETYKDIQNKKHLHREKKNYISGTNKQISM